VPLVILYCTRTYRTILFNTSSNQILEQCIQARTLHVWSTNDLHAVQCVCICPGYLLKLLEYTSCFHKWKRWTNHPDHKTLFGELHNTESFVFWQPIMATMNLLSYKLEYLFSDHRSKSYHGSYNFVELHRRFVFLSPVMAICHCWAPGFSRLVSKG